MAGLCYNAGMTNCYVYVYEVDGLVRYVGRGRGYRMAAHLKELARRERRETNKPHRFYDNLAAALATGAMVTSRKIADGLSGDDAAIREMEEIAKYPNDQLWNSIYSHNPVVLDEELRSRFSAAQRALWADPAERAKRNSAREAAMSKPGVRERQISATRAALLRPGVEEKRVQRAREAATKPEVRKKKSVAVRAAYQSEEVKARHLAALIVGMHQPGVIERRVATWHAKMGTPENKARQSRIANEVLSRPEVKNALSAKATAQWRDPEKRARILAAQERSRLLKGKRRVG